jgi:hypothetical protein
MKKQNRNDGYLALRDEPDEQRIRYSELLMMMKHKMPITKDDKKFVKTKISKGRQLREQTSKDVMQRFFTE